MKQSEVLVVGAGPSGLVLALWLRAFGVGEIAVKNGPNSVLIALAKEQSHVPGPTTVTPVDASGAGDAFNAAYLAARLTGETSHSAATAGHKLAAEVIQHPGALRTS